MEGECPRGVGSAKAGRPLWICAWEREWRKVGLGVVACNNGGCTSHLLLGSFYGVANLVSKSEKN